MVPEQFAADPKRYDGRMQYRRCGRSGLDLPAISLGLWQNFGSVDAFETTYDRLMRPSLVLQAIRTLQDAGVEPDVWKVEGLDRRQDCEHVVATARRGGRNEVGCIVLGRNAERGRVLRWLQTAASVPGFIGFAIGRTTFWDAVAAYVAKQVTRQEAAWLIARRYREWAIVFEQARRSHAGAA